MACRRAALRLFLVVESARGNKVAERMLTEMIAWGDANNVSRYQLNAEPKARSLYERLGFTRLPERDWSPVPGVDLIVYALEL